MAYSGYGGYAYKNGKHVIERSDAVLSPKGIAGSTPGAWPGWAMPEGRCGNSYHVILGDGPIFVVLYKQSYVGVFRLGEEIEGVLSREWDDDKDQWGKFSVDDHNITAHWVHRDNYYVFVRLEQPDGTVWTGWSGYGVGAGFEDGCYGHSNGQVQEWAVEMWSESKEGKG